MLLLTYLLTYLLYVLRNNVSLTFHNSPPNLAKDHLVAWLLQSGMDYLLTSDFPSLMTPSNTVLLLVGSSDP